MQDMNLLVRVERCDSELLVPTSEEQSAPPALIITQVSRMLKAPRPAQLLPASGPPASPATTWLRIRPAQLLPGTGTPAQYSCLSIYLLLNGKLNAGCSFDFLDVHAVVLCFCSKLFYFLIFCWPLWERKGTFSPPLPPLFAHPRKGSQGRVRGR